MDFILGIAVGITLGHYLSRFVLYRREIDGLSIKMDYKVKISMDTREFKRDLLKAVDAVEELKKEAGL